MKIIANLLKDAYDEKLVKITEIINNLNPMVDRIMDDDSVEGVVMTNEQGAPLLTNMNKVVATTGGLELSALGVLASRTVKEVDILDEILVMRLSTKNNEIMISPHKDFNIIVLQRARTKRSEDVKKRGNGI